MSAMGLVYPKHINQVQLKKMHDEYWEGMSSGIFGFIIGKGLKKVFKKEIIINKKVNEMLTDEQLDLKLQESPAERVTEEYMKSRIENVKYIRVDETVTICNIRLDNGFSVRGESACVKTKNFDHEAGEKISYGKAFNKLWELFGFVLAENGTLKQ